MYAPLWITVIAEQDVKIIRNEMVAIGNTEQTGERKIGITKYNFSIPFFKTLKNYQRSYSHQW